MQFKGTLLKKGERGQAAFSILESEYQSRAKVYPTPAEP